MSDVPPGAGAHGTTAGRDVPTGPLDPARTPPPATAPYGDTASGYDTFDTSAKERAKQAANEGKQAAVDVKDTAKEQAQRVAHEAGTQVRGLASDVRDRLGEQARGQNDKLVGTIRQTADQLDEMRGDRSDGPAAAVVSRVADGGRQFADYLDRHGPDGVLREVQDFARRRPGAFLVTALAAGFVVGRLGKSVAKADPAPSESKPASDAYVSHDPGPAVAPPTTTYGEAVTTEYAATGTGTPAVVPPTVRPGGPL